MIKYVTKDVIDEYIKTENYDFALEAYDYNSKINNWETPIIAMYSQDKIIGLLYYRYIDVDLIQLVNIYSKEPGAGTKLFNELLNKEYKYMFFYMGKNAVNFYKKYGIVPLEESEDFMVTFIDKNNTSIIPDKYKDFILTKLNKKGKK